MPRTTMPFERPRIPRQVPILLLRSPVVFPTAVLAVQLTSRGSLALLDGLVEDRAVVGLFYLDHEEKAAGAGELPPVGVAARLVQRLRLGPGQAQAIFHGLSRIRLERVVQSHPSLLGRVSPIAGAAPESPLEVDALTAHALQLFERLAHVDRRYGPEAAELVKLNARLGPDPFSDLLASVLDLPPEEERRLVQMVDPAERLRRLGDVLEQMLERVAVAEDVDETVRAHLEEKHREILLREQLQAIQQKLGEGREASRVAAEYRVRLEGLPLDADVKESLQRDCRRLAAMPEGSQELALTQGYFDFLLSLPWESRTAETLDLARAEAILNRNHQGVAEVKERILEYLATVKLKGQLGGPVLCLVGPPGTGKTTLARSVAEALGRKFVRLSLGGVTDEAEIRGHRRTYLGAMPGRLIAAYERARVKNPVVLLDEVDKVGRELRGDPAAALLEILDPEQNRAFLDRYLAVPFDLSETLFVATANLVEAIPAPLRDRLEVLEIPGYTEEEKAEIAARHILPKALEAHGLTPNAVELDPGALLALIRGYTAEAGVRELDRKVNAICRKAARQWATGGARARRRQTVRVEDLERHLGPVAYQQEFAGRSPEVGLATGLAWTATGGVILFIEAVRMPGTGRIEVTGHLGEVMRESVQAAYSYVRSRARDLEISTEAFRETDLHVHFPGGAIPKDGPSAGVAVATCIASLLSGRPVRHDLAMTGEISLRGKVLSVGGIREKVLAAHRAAIRTVVLPAGNRKDLPSLPPGLLDEVRILFAEWVDDVWREALVQVFLARRLEEARELSGSLGRLAPEPAPRPPQPL